MLSNYDIAKFNAAAYTHSSKNVITPGWRELTNSDQTKTSNAGYYGIAFINEHIKTIAIASSGTVFNSITSLPLYFYANYQILTNKTPNQFCSGASPFADAILNELGDKAAQYQFITTGHSLGAVLSNLINAKLTAQNLKANSINIESPGSRFVLEDYITTQKLNVSPDNLHITTYNAPPNLVNSRAQEIGTIYEFKLPMERSSIGQFFGWPIQKVTDTIDTHYLSNILHYAFNKETGDYIDCVLVSNNQTQHCQDTYS